MKQWQARTAVVVSFIAGIVILLFSRFYGLDLKPIHHDESVNMWWVMEIWNQGFFHYDPTNYHGPLLFYLFHWLEALGADSLVAYRALCSLFNVSLIALVTWWSYRQRKSWLLAPALLLFSPAMIFFSRSAIHESAFIFFQVMAFLGVVDFLSERRERGIKFFIWGLVGALSLKETFVIPIIAAVVALLFLAKTSWQTLRPLDEREKKTFYPHFIAGVLVWIALYSDFYTYPQGLLDFFKAFMPWTQTGVAGNGHEKPFTYWLEIMLKDEPLAASALFFTVGGCLIRSQWAKVLGIFALVNLFLYSVIPYKTPWCLISILWPIYFSGAESFGYFWPRMKTVNRVVMTVAVLALVFAQGRVAYQISYKKPLNLEHEYVYVQTTQAAKNAFDLIHSIARVNPLMAAQPIFIYASEEWPFPAEFRDFNRVFSIRPRVNIEDQDFSAIPNDIGIIFTEADLERQNQLLKKLGLERLPCEHKFQIDLENCQFVLRPGMAPYQLIFSKEAQ